jgi:uncharacterized protein
VIVIADTSPLNYLIQIDSIDLLTLLFKQVHIPSAVLEELQHLGAPDRVRVWSRTPPEWVTVHSALAITSELQHLDAGEQQALALAHKLKAYLILIDEWRGRGVARRLGFEITGTLGVLALAHRRGWIDADAKLDVLITATDFRISEQVVRDFRAILRSQ